MSSTKEGFSSGPEVTTATMISDVDLDEESRIGSGQAFFEGDGLIAMNSDKRLCCLSRTPTLKLEVISSSSSSSSQIIGGTGRSTPTFGSLLENKDDEEENEANDENREAGGKVLTL